MNDARTHVRAAGLLGALLLVVYWRPLVLPRALVPADLVFATPFFARAAPPGLTGPANELLFDQAYQFVPWRHFAHESLRRGELPLWKPQSFSGTPFAATLSAAVFYPLNLALTALPFARTFVWSAVVRLWVAGFSTYLLGRTYGLGPGGAVLAGIAFMLSGYLTVWLGHPHTNVAVLLPFLLLADERLLAATVGEPRRGLRKIVRLAQHPARSREEFHSGAGDQHAPLRALEQPHAERALELRHLRGERRLRDGTQVRRLPEAPRLGDDRDVLELAKRTGMGRPAHDSRLPSHASAARDLHR